jgi:hypothetical protein
VTKWEYTWFKETRGYGGTLFGAHSKEWELVTGGELLRQYGKIGFVELIQRLGDDGWELVSVVPRSSIGGAESSGFTSEQVWIFKRPKT